MTFLAEKKTYRYGDSIAYPQVSRVPAPATRPPQHAVRVYPWSPPARDKPSICASRAIAA